MNADGTVDAANSKGFPPGTVAHVAGSGTYCISALGFTPRNAVGSIGADATAAAIVTQIGAVPGCATGTQISVETTDGLDGEFMININN